MPIKRNIPFLVILVFISGGGLLVQHCKPRASMNFAEGANQYVGEKECKTCHATEYNSWAGSGHYKAMLAPTDSTVSGNFNNQELVDEGITTKFFKKNGKFYINTDDENGQNRDFEIKYTFGYYPLQQYLVEFPGGRLQATRATWDVKKKRWYNQYAGVKISPHDWLHWTGNGQNWNTMCADCHSTNLQKNFNTDSDTYHTTFSSINVSCETCHGPGQHHISYVKSENYKEGQKQTGAFIVLQKKSSQLSEIETCAICHARRAEISAKPEPGAPLMDNYIPEIPTTDHYFADGQANDEDYNYTSFVQSKMFRQGVRCSNCHEPHSATLKFNGNSLCMQCHAQTYNSEAHTFHSIGSAGAECKNCHMPSKIYMGIDQRYDHTFRVPRPDLSVTYGTPNACNNCHQDKTAKWAADAISKWYGPTRKYHFAEDLIPGSRQDSNSEAHLIKLIRDTSVPDIVKAASANYLGNIQTGNSLDALTGLLNSGGDNSRYRALKSLSNFPPDKWIYAAGSLLTDSIRAVRLAAAELYMRIPADQLPQEYHDAYVKAKAELDNYMFYQADFSIGDVVIGDYFLKQNNYSEAEKFYRRGLVKDPLMNYARLNLSVALNLSKQNDESLMVLKEAAEKDPKNDRIFFNMALLYNEMGNQDQASKCLEHAVELHSANPRVYYNYGLMLEKQGNVEKAINMYKKGIQIAPADASLNYALALLYIKSGDLEKAKVPAAVLKKYYPGNTDYNKISEYLKL